MHAASHRAEEKLRSLKARLGEKSCHLVQINSGSDAAEDGKYDGLFQAQRWQALSGGGAGEPEAHAPVPSMVKQDKYHSQNMHLSEVVNV